VISRLDWLRRLQWVPLQEASLTAANLGVTAAGLRQAMHMVSPSGKVYRGYEAFRMLLLLLPGPLYVVFAVARFGGFGSRFLGIVSAHDLIFLMAAGLLVLWAPGASRRLGQPLYARVASARYRILSGVFGVNCDQGACSVHASRGARVEGPADPMAKGMSP
jgi:hypothetical protein